MANGMNQLIKYEKTNTGLRVQEEPTIILGIDISGPHYQKQGSPVALDTWAHHHWNTFESLRMLLGKLPQEQRLIGAAQTQMVRFAHSDRVQVQHRASRTVNTFSGKSAHHADSSLELLSTPPCMPPVSYGRVMDCLCWGAGSAI